MTINARPALQIARHARTERIAPLVCSERHSKESSASPSAIMATINQQKMSVTTVTQHVHSAMDLRSANVKDASMDTYSETTNALKDVKMETT